MQENSTRKRAKEFARKVKSNEDASLILSIEEAQQLIWWWIYTEEFTNQKDINDIVENLRIEFRYDHYNDDIKPAEKIIKHRIYDEKTSDLTDDRMWLPIHAEEFLEHLSENW
jgi:hypothetical protein